MTHRTKHEAKHEASERETPTQHHTPEEMDALLQAALDSFTAARTALDAYTAERLQWVSDNIPAYNEAAGRAIHDQRKVQNALMRVIELTLLTFHPDRVAVLAYGPQLAEVVETLKFENVAMIEALARHAPPAPPPAEAA